MGDINKIYQDFIYKRTYARWDYEKGRRENWEETVDRYFEYFKRKVPEDLLPAYKTARKFVLERKVMPSMRALWTAGPALDEDNICGYNCGYLVMDSPKKFAEILYILMQGTGIGFSVERQYVNKLPKVPNEMRYLKKPVVFEDSKLGWAEGFLKIIEGLYAGKVLEWDLSKIRPEGAILKKFGGRASGPEPLDKLLSYVRDLFLKVSKERPGDGLNSIEVHDINCMTANSVICGGVRRSAALSLSNHTDLRMRDAKIGQFWDIHPYRALANNSIAYTEKPEIKLFIEEWRRLIESKTGERGIFNREAAKQVATKSGRRKVSDEFGCNACSEIILLPDEFCNLTEVVVHPNDSLNDLTKKVKFATILGILQSTLTDFKFIDDAWYENCLDERLLGVSLTGIKDHPVLGNAPNPVTIEWLKTMKGTAIRVAKKWSKILNINIPAAITCTKPSGSVSQLVNSSSGIHPRYSDFYIRRVRSNKTDPLCKYLISKGVPFNPENGQGTFEECNTVVFDFPLRSPSDSVKRNQETAVEQLEHWKMFQEYWCEHKPSMTCYVKEHEWLEVGAWCYKNWDLLSGISFLPYSEHIYQLAPYEEITEDEYNKLLNSFPKDLNFDDLVKYEEDDYTEGSQEYACVGGACELV